MAEKPVDASGDLNLGFEGVAVGAIGHKVGGAELSFEHRGPLLVEGTVVEVEKRHRAMPTGGNVERRHIGRFGH